MDYGTFYRRAGNDTQCVVCSRPIDDGEWYYRIVGAGYHLCQCVECVPRGGEKARKDHLQQDKERKVRGAVRKDAAEMAAWRAGRRPLSNRRAGK